ncbi:MAG: hypothetical protein U0N42_11990 [Roseburia intestinalis]
MGKRGCLIKKRNKNACVEVMMLCETVTWCKHNGNYAFGGQLSLHENYGYCKEDIETMTLKDMDGAEKIQRMMNEMNKRGQ